LYKSPKNNLWLNKISTPLSKIENCIELHYFVDLLHISNIKVTFAFFGPAISETIIIINLGGTYMKST